MKAKVENGHVIKSFIHHGKLYLQVIYISEDDRVEMVESETRNIVMTFHANCEVSVDNKTIGRLGLNSDNLWFYQPNNVEEDFVGHVKPVKGDLFDSIYKLEQNITVNFLSKKFIDGWKVQDFNLSENNRILTRSEVEERFKTRTDSFSVMAITEVLPLEDIDKRKAVYFFISNYLFGVKTLPRNFVPGSIHVPMKVKPRPGVEDGWVSCFDSFNTVFHSDNRERCIESIEDLVQYLNQYYFR